MKRLIFSDLHIKESDFEELQLVCDELVTIAKQEKVDEIISLGDQFDHSVPTPNELVFLSNFLKSFKKPIKLIVAKSHESISKEQSYFHHLPILNSKIEVASEFVIDNCFFGHFTFKESKFGYGSEQSIKGYNKYDLVLTGHVHDFEEIVKGKIYQLGNVRFIRADETEQKRVAIIEDKKIQFINLKSYYPLFNVTISEKAFKNAITETNKFPEKAKIRVVFKDFESMQKFYKIREKYSKKFYKYWEKKDFVQDFSELKKDKKDIKEFVQEFKDWAKEQKINKEVKNVILDVMK